MPCPRTQYRNNDGSVLREEKHVIYLHQAGIELARQAAVITKRHALTIVPSPSLEKMRQNLWGLLTLTRR